MRRIGLVACSSYKNKEAKKDHGMELPASEMYTGHGFKNAVEHGLEHFGCEGYFILSGKYGLLSPDDMIRWYDCDLKKMPVSYQKEWSEKVYKSLQEKLGDLDDIQFVLFCGETYYKGYIERLKHWIRLKYKMMNITFEIREER